MRTAARFLLILILFLFSTLLLAHTSYAQTSPYAPDTNPDVPNNLHTYTQSVTLEVLSSIFCLVAGKDPMDTTHGCLGIDPNTKKIGYTTQNGGAIGLMASLTGALYTPPVHVGEYFASVTHDFGFVKHAYAATNGDCNATLNGVGFCGISPLIGIWTTSRNIVYLLFVVIFILVGFGIMFRMKIDPRTVMSIENQIPKLIIALLMVTFSFTIAGLLIDGMWIGSFVAVNLLTSADKTAPIPASTVTGSFFENPLGFANNVLPGGIIGVAAGGGGSLGDVVKGVLTGDNSNKLGLTPPVQNRNCQALDVGCHFQDLTTGTLNDIMGAIFGNIVALLIYLLGALVILIAILASMIRLWFSLLLSYVYLLIDVILGPFMIAFGVFPGSKMGVGAWVRDMLGNLIAFPIAISMFLMGRLLMDAFTTSGGGRALVVFPLMGNPNGTVNTTSPFGWLIGIAIIFMTPKAVEIGKGLAKSPENKLLGSIFQPVEKSLGTASKVGGGLLNTGFGNLTEYKNGQLQATPFGIKKIAQAFGVIR